jgi:hypothetical protein
MKYTLLMLTISGLVMSAKVSAQQIETKVFTVSTTISVSSGETIELFSAEGKYSTSGYIGTSSTAILSGPIVKVTKDSAEFPYPVAPIGMNIYEGLYRGLSIGSYAGSTFVNSWVFSGDSASLVVEGPATLAYSTNASNNEPFLLTFKKYASRSTESTSATSVVIPTAATGDVDVKLEQSADNVTWTECLPGTYNSSTVKRFFRLRAVEK